MPADVEQLIDALRAEVHGFGEMLALLDESSATHIPPGARPATHAALESIRQQGRLIQVARARRQEAEARLNAFAAAAHTPIDPRSASAHDVSPTEASVVPNDYVPLLQALTNEVDDLAGRVRQQAIALHTRLTSAADEIEEFVGWIHNPEIHILCN